MATYGSGMAVEKQFNRADINSSGAFSFSITSPGTGGFFKFFHHGWSCQTVGGAITGMSVSYQVWHNPSGNWLTIASYTPGGTQVVSPTTINTTLAGLFPTPFDEGQNFTLIGNSASDGMRLLFSGTASFDPGETKITYIYSMLRYY